MKRGRGQAVKVLAALSLAALALVLGIAGWQALGALIGRKPALAPVPAVNTPAQTAAAETPQTPPTPASALAVANPLPLAPASAAAAAPPRALAWPTAATERIDLCGHGAATVQDIERLYPTEVQLETRQRLLEALGRGGEREQAVGWLMASQLAVDRTMVRGGPACGADSDCLTRATAAAAVEVAQALEALIGLARGSSDPGLYALAVAYACRGTQTAQPGCAALSPAEWQRRSPGDAAPWLWQADLAAQQGQTAAVHAALMQAARAPRLATQFGDPYTPLFALPLWRGLKPMQQMDALIGMIGATAALPFSVQPAWQFCKEGQSDRRATCDGLTRHFVSDSATALHLAIGFRMAQRLGWSGERLREVEERRNAWEGYSQRSGMADFFSCTAIDQNLKNLRETAALGEVAAMRRHIDESGRPWAEWVEQGRQFRQRREKAASQAGG